LTIQGEILSLEVVEGGSSPLNRKKSAVQRDRLDLGYTSGNK